MKKDKSKKLVGTPEYDSINITGLDVFLFMKNEANLSHVKGTKSELAKLVCNQLEMWDNVREIILDGVELYEKGLKKKSSRHKPTANSKIVGRRK